MFKFLRWYWRKAQAAAATEILARARRYSVTSGQRNTVEIDRLEHFVIDQFILPSKSDDNPQVEVTTSGVSPIINPKVSSSEESRRNS